MPLYEFRCGKCGQEFEAFQTMAEHASARWPACPRCRSPKRVEPELSPFYAQTTRKA